MAKCIKKGEETRRVDNQLAKRLVEKEGWEYIPKHMMKYYRTKDAQRKAGN